MIYPIQEGKALHKLKCLLNNRDKYTCIKVDFGEAEHNVEFPFDITNVMTSFRYRQYKLGEGLFQAYPHQLISLAQYYFYCGKNAAREDVRKKINEWFKAVCDALTGAEENEPEKYKSMVSGLLTRFFDVPLYDNIIPLEAVLSEAEFAGSMDKPAYPPCSGLIIFDYNEASKTYFYSVADKDIEDFWKVQLWAMADCERGPCTEEEKSKEELIGFVNSRRTQSMFALSVWYARQLSILHKNQTKVNEDDHPQLIRFNTNRLKNSFLEFSTDGNLSRAVADYSKFIRRSWIYDKSTIAFLYRNPKKLNDAEKEEVKSIILPDPEILDPGVRIFDEMPFYGIKPQMLKLLFKEPMTSKAKKIPVYIEGNNICRCYFDDKPDFDAAKAAEEQIKEIFEQVKSSRDTAIEEFMNSKDAKEAFIKLGKGEMPDENEMKALSDIFKNKELTKKQEECWANIRNNEKNIDIRKKWYSIIHTDWVKKCTDKEIIKPWFNSLPESMRMEIRVGEHPYETLAAVLVRSKTMLILWYKKWIRCGKPTSEVVIWNSAEHLLIPGDLLKAEKNIIKNRFCKKKGKKKYSIINEL